MEISVRLVAILGLLAVVSVPAAALAAEYAYIAPSSVMCREEGYPSSAVVENLKRGMQVTVIERVDQWANIERGDQTCWVTRRDLSRNCPFASPVAAPPAKASRMSRAAKPQAPVRTLR